MDEVMHKIVISEDAISYMRSDNISLIFLDVTHRELLSLIEILVPKGIEILIRKQE